MRTTRWMMTTAVLSLLVAGCGTRDGGASQDAPASAEGRPAAVLATADSDLGEIVVDAEGRTVYVFDEDEPGSGESACSGACLESWPAVVAEGGDPAADGVQGELGTIERDDGTLQVTLEGSPLYLFVGDAGPGDVTGQAVQDVWWVVGPDGEKVPEAPAAGGDFSY